MLVAFDSTYLYLQWLHLWCCPIVALMEISEKIAQKKWSGICRLYVLDNKILF